MTVYRGMVAILMFLFLCLIGCAPKSSDVLVLEVGTEKVTLADYEDFFIRNSGGIEVAKKSTPEERQHFLDLLTNYKLKLADAYDHNLQNDTSIINELHDYRASLASSYLIEHQITEPGVKALYDRKREELRARHILLKVAPDAAPEESLRVYTKATDLIKRLKAGESFDTLAAKFSDDPSAKVNFGDVYYFSGGVMYGPFETAAYALKKGEISPVPARTPFGYHVIQVTDRQPSRGSIRVSHIMARFQSTSPDSADTTAALGRIHGILDSLKKGWDFHKLAVKLSEDAGSAQQSGDLGWFERRRFVQPFDEAAFKLTAGQTSGIVRTPYGYHIIHCDSAKGLPPYSDTKYHDELKKDYQQHRYLDDYTKYVEMLKQRIGYSIDNTVLAAFIGSLDSNKTTDDSAWAAPITIELREKTLFTIGNHPMKLDTVIVVLQNRPEYRNLILRSADLRNKIGKMGEAFLFENASANLEKQSTDFALLMKDYTDGIILYKAEQEEVWNKTAVTDTALRQYYNENSAKFSFPERVNIAVLEFDTDTLAYLVYDSLKHNVDFSSYLMRFSENPPDPNQKEGGRGLQSISTDTLTKYAATLKVGAFSEPIEKDTKFVIIKLLERQEPRQKTYEEAGPELSNAYQEHASKVREQDWLDSIKLRHPVVQHSEGLKDAFRSYPDKQ